MVDFLEVRVHGYDFIVIFERPEILDVGRMRGDPRVVKRHYAPKPTAGAPDQPIGRNSIQRVIGVDEYEIEIRVDLPRGVFAWRLIPLSQVALDVVCGLG